MKKATLFFVFVFSSLVFHVQAQSATKVIPIAQHYEGGQEALLADIQKKLQYPIMAKKNRIQGECIVSLSLDKDGKPEDYKLLKNIGGGCGDEALRVVKMLKFKAPGYRVDGSVPVKFSITPAGTAKP